MELTHSANSHFYGEFEKYYERFIEVVASSFSDEFVLSARNEFFALSGQITEEDLSYEQRLAWFMEWFIFDYCKDGRVPGRVFLEKCGDLSAVEREIYSNFMNFNKGLFLIKNNYTEKIAVRELFTKKGMSLFIPMGSMAFRKKEVFQGHIFSLRENYFVSPCGIFHNISVTKIIINAAENIKKNNKGRTNEDLLWLLSRLKLKAERFLKISPENIYKQEIGDTGGGWLSKITG